MFLCEMLGLDLNSIGLSSTSPMSLWKSNTIGIQFAMCAKPMLHFYYNHQDKPVTSQIRYTSPSLHKKAQLPYTGPSLQKKNKCDRNCRGAPSGPTFRLENSQLLLHEPRSTQNGEDFTVLRALRIKCMSAPLPRRAFM